MKSLLILTTFVLSFSAMAERVSIKNTENDQISVSETSAEIKAMRNLEIKAEQAKQRNWYRQERVDHSDRVSR